MFCRGLNVVISSSYTQRDVSFLLSQFDTENIDVSVLSGVFHFAIRRIRLQFFSRHLFQLG